MPEYFYAPQGFLAERRERLFASFLREQGFFDDDAVVAIVAHDSAGIVTGVEDGLEPALRELGIEPEVKVFFPDPLESPWSNYILQMQQAGVTHIIMGASSTSFAASLFLMGTAEEQRYRPKWAMASDNSPSDLPGTGAPPAQLANVLAMGWFPWNDVLQEDPVSSGTELCNTVLSDAGLTPHPYNYAPCEFFFFLRAAFELADEVSAAGLADAVERLGAAYPSVFTMDGATKFGPGRHDGAGPVVRAVAYDETCSCMNYVGEPLRLE